LFGWHAIAVIRNEFMNEILSAIDRSGKIRAADVDLEYAKNKAVQQLNIRYKHDPRYWFGFVIPTAKTDKKYLFECRMAPGEVSAEETATFSSPSDLTYGITEWSRRLYGEMVSHPIARQIEEQSAAVNDLLKSIAEMHAAAPGYFTKAEADALKSQIEELEKRLVQLIHQQGENAKDAEEREQNLRAELNDVKSLLTKLPKKGVATLLATRVLGWLGRDENQKLIQAGTSAVKAMLGDGSGPPKT
jgi:hypothetical protein